MRISDWSSDVCSSDLPSPAPGAGVRTMIAAWHSFARQGDHRLVEPLRSVQSRGSSLPRYLRWFRIPAAQRFTEHDRLTGPQAVRPAEGAEIGRAPGRERVVQNV